VTDVAIPTGIPIVYKFDKNLIPIPPSQEERTASQIHMNGLFLEKPGLLREALKREESWSMAVPGYDSTMARPSRPMTPLERSLYKLNAVQELGDWAKDFIDPNAELEDDGNDGNMGKPMQMLEDEVWAAGIEQLESGGQFDPDAVAFHEATNSARDKAVDGPKVETEIVTPTLVSQLCITAMPSASIVNAGPVPIRRDSVIVIIRHGKTEHNKLGK
jgi:hypothetical protein